MSFFNNVDKFYKPTFLVETIQNSWYMVLCECCDQFNTTIYKHTSNTKYTCTWIDKYNDNTQHIQLNKIINIVAGLS